MGGRQRETQGAGAVRRKRPLPVPAETPEGGAGVPAAQPRRVIVENVQPTVDCGRFPVKRGVGESVTVTADIFADGHDVLRAVLRHRHCADAPWDESELEFLGNDAWQGEFLVTRLGGYEFSIAAWVDEPGSWRQGLGKKVQAEQDVDLELLEGAALARAAAARAEPADAARLRAWADQLAAARSQEERVATALDRGLESLLLRYPDRSRETASPVFRVTADRERATHGAWYELFPRSCGAEPGVHGTFRDVEARLPYVAGMGFDVLYLPPVHPIGLTHRKGANNTPQAAPGEPGSPWGIGAAEGGHTAVLPELGSQADFDRLVASAHAHGLEIALDIAFQCSPDHPWVREHPEWFRRRPDGSIQYAENPPKKYQDIFPLNFDTDDWRSLWDALRDVFLFWAEHGVRIFRVDNPHTKALPFWEWVIREVQTAHPDTVFLAEAFTRPAVLRRLAKMGFSQSYTYFTWRNTKAELTEYLTELTQTPVCEYLRPNFFANTPDILHDFLQTGGRPAFQIRLVLAAMLGATYGIYGPAFELCEGRALRPGSEEYLDSEKYQLRHWNIDRADSLCDLVTRLNRIRREHRALRDMRCLRFIPVDNEQLLCFSKVIDGEGVVVVVNLDPQHAQSGWVDLPLEDLGIEDEAYQMHDLISDERYQWTGARNFVRLDPHVMPAHVFRLRRHLRSERDFDYYA